MELSEKEKQALEKEFDEWFKYNHRMMLGERMCDLDKELEQ